jgi:hypothetical protein
VSSGIYFRLARPKGLCKGTGATCFLFDIQRLRQILTSPFPGNCHDYQEAMVPGQWKTVTKKLTPFFSVLIQEFVNELG